MSGYLGSPVQQLLPDTSPAAGAAIMILHCVTSDQLSANNNVVCCSWLHCYYQATHEHLTLAKWMRHNIIFKSNMLSSVTAYDLQLKLCYRSPGTNTPPSKEVKVKFKSSWLPCRCCFPVSSFQSHQTSTCFVAHISSAPRWCHRSHGDAQAGWGWWWLEEDAGCREWTLTMLRIFK